MFENLIAGGVYTKKSTPVRNTLIPKKVVVTGFHSSEFGDFVDFYDTEDSSKTFSYKYSVFINKFDVPKYSLEEMISDLRMSGDINERVAYVLTEIVKEIRSVNKKVDSVDVYAGFMLE